MRADTKPAYNGSRKDARNLGYSHYYTGNPCKYGHIAPRRVHNAQCLHCVRNQYRKYSRRKLPEPTRPEPTVCEACRETCFKASLSLDHSHETGEFRGWLCSRCNQALGLLDDSVDKLQNLLKYLHGNT